MTKTYPICHKEFETNRALKKYCSTKRYNKSNNLRNFEHWQQMKKSGKCPLKREPNTKCPTCEKLHYKPGYTFHDRIRCDKCDDALAKGYLVDTTYFEYRLHA